MPAKLIKAALRILSIREHSRFELEKKLKRHSSDSQKVEAALTALEQKNYLSEERFVEAFIHAKKNKGYGPRMIQYALAQRKVDLALFESMLIKYTNWAEAAEQIYLKKFGSIKITDLSEKAKRKNFLLQRGFLSEHFPDELKS